MRTEPPDVQPWAEVDRQNMPKYIICPQCGEPEWWVYVDTKTGHCGRCQLK